MRQSQALTSSASQARTHDTETAPEAEDIHHFEHRAARPCWRRMAWPVGRHTQGKISGTVAGSRGFLSPERPKVVVVQLLGDPAKCVGYSGVRRPRRLKYQTSHGISGRRHNSAPSQWLRLLPAAHGLRAGGRANIGGSGQEQLGPQVIVPLDSSQQASFPPERVHTHPWKRKP